MLFLASRRKVFEAGINFDGSTIAINPSQPNNARAVKPDRLLPHIPFPAYAFVPRQNPHPTRDPEGHSYGRPEQKPDPLTADNWQRSTDYLHGIDLFNCGYFWEAHEAWEGLWQVRGRRGHIADFLKALIKLAAAGVKAREGNANGVQRAARRATEIFTEQQSQESEKAAAFLGLSYKDLFKLAANLPKEAAEFAPVQNNDSPPTFKSRLKLASPLN